ncbi:MAG: hypothetical protein JSV21_07445 [Nitrospirota bacterium]|nr:MAG: hypothetical protein JSV21_07445 [Nitrospirota bacterium]
MVFAIYAVMIANNSLTKRMEEFERDEIMAALEDCGWVMARAARSLGITERMIGYKVNK